MADWTDISSSSTWSNGDSIVGHNAAGTAEKKVTYSNLSTQLLAAVASAGYRVTVNDDHWSGTDLAVANGGTGASTAAGARTNLDVDQAGTDNSTNVTIAAGRDYISISGQELTLGFVDLTTDVTGTLPVGNGGTGGATASAARTALGVDAAGTDNSTDVTLAGSYDYLSLSGQEITLGQIDLSTDVTGRLALSNIPQSSAASRLLGRGAASGAGDFQEVELGSGLSMSGTTLSVTAGSGSAITLDLGDDGGNDSTDLSEIAITNDAGGIFSEPSADKLLIDCSNPWPSASGLETDALDAIGEVAAALKTGSDAKLVTGTAGSDGRLGGWNADGDLVDSGYNVIDEDDMSSDSATGVPTQQSVKAFVEAQPYYIQAALTQAGENISTGTKVALVRIPVASTLNTLTAFCDPANEPSAAAVQVDCNEINKSTGAATSILSAVASISTSANEATGTISTSSFSAGDILSFDIDQGSDGKELNVELELTPT